MDTSLNGPPVAHIGSLLLPSQVSARYLSNSVAATTRPAFVHGIFRHELCLSFGYSLTTEDARYTEAGRKTDRAACVILQLGSRLDLQRPPTDVVVSGHIFSDVFRDQVNVALAAKHRTA